MLIAKGETAFKDRNARQSLFHDASRLALSVTVILTVL